MLGISRSDKVRQLPQNPQESPSRNQILDHQAYGPRRELLVEVDVTQGPLVKRVERVDE